MNSKIIFKINETDKKLLQAQANQFRLPLGSYCRTQLLTKLKMETNPPQNESVSINTREDVNDN